MNTRIAALVIGTLLVLGLLVGANVLSASGQAADDSSTPPNFKVAFIADQGLGTGSAAVLELIRDEGAHMVLHQGDFDHADDPEAWDQQINDILGPEFPYFASIGNHDVAAWPGYQAKMLSRLDRIDGATCTGDLGVKSACSYQGLFFILSGVGTVGTGHAEYIRDQLAEDESTWRICSWHKNQRLMQVGGKMDQVGWAPYEECRRAGAIIATGHEHAYARTHLMDNFETQSIASTSNTLQLERGKTFAFVSGLGGRSIRGQNDELAANEWWGAVYTREQGANYGALFCILNQNGVEGNAHCYFKDIDGVIADEFDLRAAFPGLSQVEDAEFAAEPPKERDFFGNIVSVEEGRLVVSTKDGTVEVPTSGDTIVRLPLKRDAALTDLAEGDVVAVSLEEVDGRLIASKIFLIPGKTQHRHVPGVVIAASDTHITIQPLGEGAELITFALSSATKVKFHRGTTAVTEGAFVIIAAVRNMVTGALSPDAIEIHVTPGRPRGAAEEAARERVGRGPRNRAEVRGIFEGVDDQGHGGRRHRD